MVEQNSHTMEIGKCQLQDSCKEGRQGTLYGPGLSREKMPWADVTMENSRDKRVNTLLLLLVWLRKWGDRTIMVHLPTLACLSTKPKGQGQSAGCGQEVCLIASLL